MGTRGKTLNFSLFSCSLVNYCLLEETRDGADVIDADLSMIMQLFAITMLEPGRDGRMI